MSKQEFTSIMQLAECFESLPGIGKKTASRLAYSVLKMTNEKAKIFAKAILDSKNNIRYCKKCCNFTNHEICNICEDKQRDHSIICVVEDPKDVDAIERTNEYDASYHVLHGAISPLNGVGPDDIHIKELVKRMSPDTIKEVILATNPTVEGEATAMYISKLLKPFDIKLTRLAYGVPVGASLEYADEVTLSKALQGRNEII